MSLGLDPTLAREALQLVAWGQIVSNDGLLCTRSGDPLPSDLLRLLQALHRGGYITLARRTGERPVATLSVTGTQLLDSCTVQPGTVATVLEQVSAGPAAGQLSEVVGHDQPF
jgi:hypothetical protein